MTRTVTEYRESVLRNPRGRIPSHLGGWERVETEPEGRHQGSLEGAMFERKLV